MSELAEAGGSTAPTAPWTDTAVWAACRGLATLLIDSPLRSLGDEDRNAATARLLDLLLAGLGAAAGD